MSNAVFIYSHYYSCIDVEQDDNESTDEDSDADMDDKEPVMSTSSGASVQHRQKSTKGVCQMKKKEVNR